MADNNESPHWVMNIIHTCMGLQRGEKVLVVVDEPLGYARDALLAEAVKTDPAELWSYTFPNASRPFSEYPSPLLALVTQVDAIILLFASMDTTKELPAWNGGKAAIVKGSARAGIGAFIDQSILGREMSADYEQIAAFSPPRWRNDCAVVRARASPLRWEPICECLWRAGNGNWTQAFYAGAVCLETFLQARRTSRPSKRAPKACW